MDKKWDWQEQFSSDRSIARYRCIGFSIQEKGKYCTLRLQDIPSEGRRNLAHKLRLEERLFDDWAILDKVETYRDNYYFSVLVEKAWYKSSREDWNWKKAAGFGQESAEYRCSGWKCSKEILHKLQTKRLSVYDIPFTGREKLAHEVGLDKNEISVWTSNFKAWKDENGIHVSLHVPNTWITANILAFDWDPISSAAAVGGVIGEAATSGYVQVISGMKEVRCDTFQALLLALDKYKGKLWGFTLFAHGSKSGVITDKCRGGIMNWQDELLNEVQQNNYKLGQINLMQCFSGYKGKILEFPNPNRFGTTLSQIQKNLETAYNSLNYIKLESVRVYYDDITSKKTRFPNRTNITAEIKLSINWKQAWDGKALKIHVYQSRNICLLDL